jgi:hypothetical protein
VQAAARRAEGPDPPAARVQPQAGAVAASHRRWHELVGGLAKMLQRLIGEDVELVLADAHHRRAGD